ncbi:Chloride channel protein CLC-c-like protein [Drosera capensis]
MYFTQSGARGYCAFNDTEKTWVESALQWRTFFTTAVVAIVLRAFIEFCSTGRCGLFGNGGLIMYDVSSAEGTYSGKDLLAVMFLGGVGGIFGSIYNYLIDKKRPLHQNTTRHLYISPDNSLFIRPSMASKVHSLSIECERRVSKRERVRQSQELPVRVWLL